MRRRWLGLALLLALVGPPAVDADPFGELDLFRPARPTAAPAFTVPRLGGGTLSLAAHRGQVVFVNFWATWCPPCKEEMPSMERLYQRFKNRGFTILAVSIDRGDAIKVQEFARTLRLTFPIGLDPDSRVAETYTVRGLPTSVLIDRSGRIAAVAIGARDWDKKAARAVIETLLK